MDDLLNEFLTETNESLEVIDTELVRFEREPNNAKILDNVFRLVHTIKGTCGFLGLPRLEMLAHAAETLMGTYRDGATVSDDGVSTILMSIDKIKDILLALEETEKEPEGKDEELINKLLVLAGVFEDNEQENAENEPKQETDEDLILPEEPKESAGGGTMGRELKPGEVSLDDLEAAFLNAEGPDLSLPPEKPAQEPEKANANQAAAKKEKAMANQTIRVNVQTIENLMNMVSELVLTRNQLLEISRRNEGREEESEFNTPLQRLSNVTAELQEGVMKTRMQPIGSAWGKLPRIVRDLSVELGKPIDLEMIGNETELDRQVLELIRDPLTHMVRNSADHGIEMPDVREKAGKSKTGTIRLSAHHEGGHILISIADDGKGLNTEKLSEKLISQGLASESEVNSMSDAQIHKYIFHPGFSTAEKVTAVSGRGVGMDVVRTNIELIGGSIDLKSAEGSGTTVTVKIPLTLAIIPALIIESAGERFAIPQLAVSELVRVNQAGENRIEKIKNAEVLRLRNSLLPIVRLSDLLNMERKQEKDDNVLRSDSTFVVVTEVGTRSFGVIVDEVFHTEEIVVKPMSGMLKDVSMFSGNTIMGDGSVIMILDPNGLSQSIGSAHEEVEKNELSDEKAKNKDNDIISLLIFEAGSSDPKAVPLSLVTRLEEFDCSSVERAGNRHMVQYRDRLMPLVYVNEEGNRQTEGAMPMMVFAEGERVMGLVVDRIIDIVEAKLELQVDSDMEGFLGSAIICERATEVLDVGYFLPKAYSDWFERKEQVRPRARRLLYAEDSPFFRNMIVPVLIGAGYDVTAVEDGIEAFDLVQEGAKFDIVVTDIEMPNMDGFTLTRCLSENKNSANWPVIALSAFVGEASEERAKALGMFDFIAKFDRKGLIDALKRTEQVIDVEVAA
ncbi:MAG: chemotaxis protein CheW [Devosiaceae bacterium]|nr:chemotaxis protein CheW [Devosiaceae bacterium]